jgi:cation:H+ antiporter
MPAERGDLMEAAFGTPLVAWAAFAICAAVIAKAGSALCHHADVLAEKLEIGRTGIGLILLAFITSSPELVTGMSSVILADAPDIAVGDIFGSCLFNLLLLVLIDVLYREESIFRRSGQGHALAAGFGVILLSISGFSILLSQGGGGERWSIGHIGLSTPVIAAVYLLSGRVLFVFERTEAAQSTAKPLYPDESLRGAIRGSAITGSLVALAGTGLPFAGEAVASAMEWEASFVGTVFVALATSLPEVTVVVTAVRMRAIELSMGDLLGSNLFNLFILALDDLAYIRGPLLAAASPVHATTVLTAVLMTGIAMVGLISRPERRLFRMISWISVSLAAVYLAYVLVISL